MAKQANSTHPQQTYVRFPLAQRIEHLLLFASFTTLAVTGLPQKYAGTAIGEALIGLFGGIETVRVIHHAAAIVFGLEIVYHVIVLAYKVFVLRVEMSMLPGVRDITDALDVIRYNLGLTKERPQLPRYSFEEKAEYWALIWGAVIMGFTGFMLWNPIVTANLLPGEVIPTAKVAHGGEAVLAVLAIIVWHFYNVHLKTFNKSFFTGKLTQHQMEQEHGEELERLERGDARPVPPEPMRRRRERIFIPIALVIALVGVVGLYLFATYETTAIATLPSPVTQVPVFAPLTPTPVPTPIGGVDNTKIGVPMKHAVAGMEQCDNCHNPKGVKPNPADHEGRPVQSCLVCHRPGPTPTPGPAETAQPAGQAPAIPHSITEATYKDCVACHGQGKMKPGPANHASYTNENCTTCHQPAAAATPAAGATPGATGQPTVGPKPIPANHDLASETFKDCLACHGQDKMKPAPAGHAGFTVETCTTCHKPQGQ